MKKYIKLDISQAQSFFTEKEYAHMQQEITAAHKLLRARTGAGNDFLGWLELPPKTSKPLCPRSSFKIPFLPNPIAFLSSSGISLAILFKIFACLEASSLTPIAS